MKNLGLGIRITWYLLSVFLISGFLGFGQTVQANEFSNWDALLKKYVASKTIEGIPLYAVNYQALGNDPLYRTVIADLEKAPVEGLSTKEEKLAFWINAYNIMAVKMVLDHYPLKSIKDAGGLFSSVWKLNVGTVGGKARTLNEMNMTYYGKWGNPGFMWRSFAPR